MIELIIKESLKKEFREALLKSGTSEIGGIMMAQHININKFELQKITIHKKGSFVYFLRKIEDAVEGLSLFFKTTSQNYKKFNYIGEWHSHPSFSPYPSQTDDSSMKEIIQDPNVGANFAVLLIVKLDIAKDVIGTAHVYLPDGSRHKAILTL